MTLTDPVTDGEWRRLKPVLDEICRDALGEPLVIDAVTLLHEPSADAPFEIVGRFALSGAAAGM